jgi:L-2-hydroxyglutarate oxidase LhgO
MNIAIIGGGWVGCHLAHVLKNEHNVTLYEKNDEIFGGTSYYNQNRLHYGYHYARNYNTRMLCKSTFYRFINDYGFCVEEVKKNIYCVAEKFSLIDLETYIKIFDDYPTNKVEHNFTNTEGCILTNEKYINFEKAKFFFQNEKPKSNYWDN